MIISKSNSMCPSSDKEVMSSVSSPEDEHRAVIISRQKSGQCATMLARRPIPTHVRVGRSDRDRRGFFQSARAEVIVWLFATWHSTGENSDELERKRAQEIRGVSGTSLVPSWALFPSCCRILKELTELHCAGLTKTQDQGAFPCIFSQVSVRPKGHRDHAAREICNDSEVATTHV